MSPSITDVLFCDPQQVDWDKGMSKTQKHSSDGWCLSIDVLQLWTLGAQAKLYLLPKPILVWMI